MKANRASKLTLLCKILLGLVCGLFSLFSSALLSNTLHFKGIENLSEQEIGNIVFNQICHEMGLKVKVELLPANRAERAVASGLAAGEIMRIYSYGETNDQVVRVPTPYYSLKTTAFALTNNSQATDLLPKLEEANVGIVRGVKHTLRYIKESKQAMQVMSTEQLIELLRMKRIDLAITSHVDGIQFLNKNLIADIRPLQPILANHHLYIYLNKRYASLVPLFDDKIKQLQASGKLDVMIRVAEEQVMSIQ
ncbi:substrate-binding periplasmic protein [Shewanella maritima]|uniref:substrate-binding periplasmic protein n=1 Tax=Shewanella maritima TaxID=2520507 RepID=UPI00373578F2